jgi:hypothetical protein
MTPDQRSERARVAGLASAAKRKAAAAAAREAAGLPEPTRGNYRKPLPSTDELSPYVEAIRAERDAAGLPTLSEYQLMRESALRQRRDIAQQTYNALKGDR